MLGLQYPGAILIDGFAEHLQTVHLVVPVQVVDTLSEVPGPALRERKPDGEGVIVGESDVAKVDVVCVPLGFGEDVVLVGGGEWEGIVVLKFG